MKWKIIRNENNEITRYELTKDIYIERDLVTSFKGDAYYLTLIINGESYFKVNGSGYTLKDKKAYAEKYIKEALK